MGKSGELKQVLEHWPITPKQIKPYKDVYKVKAREGLYCLKEMDKKTRRALALEGAFEHLEKREFVKTAIPLRNREGRILCQSATGRHYILTEWLVGHRPSFADSDADIVGAATTLALMHRSSQGFDSPPGGRLRNRLDRLPLRLANRLRAVVALREELRYKRFLDNFDRAFIEYYPWILERAQEGQSTFETAGYENLVKIARKSRGFCHGDPAERNFIHTDAKGYCMIDFDLARRDIPVVDIYKLCRDVLKKRLWHIRAAQLLIGGYGRVSPLSVGELSVLYALLCYPHKLIHLLLRYYVKREGKSYGWSAHRFVGKIHELGKQQALTDVFLGAFRSEYNIK